MTVGVLESVAASGAGRLVGVIISRLRGSPDERLLQSVVAGALQSAVTSTSGDLDEAVSVEILNDLIEWLADEAESLELLIASAMKATPSCALRGRCP